MTRMTKLSRVSQCRVLARARGTGGATVAVVSDKMKYQCNHKLVGNRARAGFPLNRSSGYYILLSELTSNVSEAENRERNRSRLYSDGHI